MSLQSCNRSRQLIYPKIPVKMSLQSCYRSRQLISLKISVKMSLQSCNRSRQLIYQKISVKMSLQSCNRSRQLIYQKIPVKMSLQSFSPFSNEFNVIQLVFNDCVEADDRCPPSELHHCVVIHCWSSEIMECMLFTFEIRVLLFSTCWPCIFLFFSDEFVLS